MNEIYARERLDEIVWYSKEDQADEAATTALKYLNFDHRKYAKGIQHAIRVPDADSQRCQADIASNREPPCGNLSSPHHSNCWRAWRIINFGSQNDRLPNLN